MEMTPAQMEMTPAQFEYIEYSQKIARTQQRIAAEQNPNYVRVLNRQLDELVGKQDYLGAYLKVND